MVYDTLANKPLKHENVGDPFQPPTAVFLFTYSPSVLNLWVITQYYFIYLLA